MATLLASAASAVLSLAAAAYVLYEVKDVLESDCFAKKRMAHALAPRVAAERLLGLAVTAGATAMIAPDSVVPLLGAHAVAQSIGDLLRSEFAFHMPSKKGERPLPIDYLVDLGLTTAASLVVLTVDRGSIQDAWMPALLTTTAHVGVHYAAHQAALQGVLDHRSRN